MVIGEVFIPEGDRSAVRRAYRLAHTPPAIQLSHAARQFERAVAARPGLLVHGLSARCFRCIDEENWEVHVFQIRFSARKASFLGPGTSTPTECSSLREALDRWIAAALAALEDNPDSYLQSIHATQIMTLCSDYGVGNSICLAADFWDRSREEFVRKTWSPDRVLDWCLPHDERRDILGSKA